MSTNKCIPVAQRIRKVPEKYAFKTAKKSSFIYISDLLNMSITFPESEVLLFHREIRLGVYI